MKKGLIYLVIVCVLLLFVNSSYAASIWRLDGNQGGMITQIRVDTTGDIKFVATSVQTPANSYWLTVDSTLTIGETNQILAALMYAQSQDKAIGVFLDSGKVVGVVIL